MRKRLLGGRRVHQAFTDAGFPAVESPAVGEHDGAVIPHVAVPDTGVDFTRHAREGEQGGVVAPEGASAVGDAGDRDDRSNERPDAMPVLSGLDVPTGLRVGVDQLHRTTGAQKLNGLSSADELGTSVSGSTSDHQSAGDAGGQGLSDRRIAADVAVAHERLLCRSTVVHGDVRVGSGRCGLSRGLTRIGERKGEPKRESDLFHRAISNVVEAFPECPERILPLLVYRFIGSLSSTLYAPVPCVNTLLPVAYIYEVAPV